MSRARERRVARRFLLYPLVGGLGLVLASLVGFVARPSPPALDPAVPRSTCADLRASVDAGPGGPRGVVMVVHAARFAFQCDPGVMRGQFVCEDFSFPAQQIPICTPGSIDQFTDPSDLLVVPLGAGHVAVTQVCLGCKLGAKRYVSKEDAERFRAAAPYALGLGLALVVAFVVVFFRARSRAGSPATSDTGSDGPASA